MVRLKQIKNDNWKISDSSKETIYKDGSYIDNTEIRLHQKNIFIWSANSLLPSNVSIDWTTIDGLIQSIRS